MKHYEIGLLPELSEKESKIFRIITWTGIIISYWIVFYWIIGNIIYYSK